MAIQIIIDSASDILPDEAKRLGLVHVPLTVTFDGVEYKDGVTISHKKFYEFLIESSALPTTSQVNPAVYGEAIKKVLDAGNTPLIITLSSALSGTYQSATIAADDADGDVYVVDSLNVTVGERLLIYNALEYIKDGLDIEDIVDRLNEDKKHIKLMALLDTLEYLKKGGRISATVAFAGGVLSIKPVIEIVDGAVSLVGKARGSKNANNLLRELITKGNGIDFDRPICLAYTGLTDEYIQKYVADSEDLWKNQTNELEISTVGATIGTHIGPGAIAVSFFEKY